MAKKLKSPTIKSMFRTPALKSSLVSSLLILEPEAQHGITKGYTRTKPICLASPPS